MTSPAPFRPAPPGAKVVLVVDDDPSICTLVATTLSQEFEVYIAESAPRASEILKSIPRPALIVSDVAMPAIDGIQFVKGLRAAPETATLPVIFLTSKTMPMDVVAGINAGARHYIAKPFKPMELLDKARKVTSR